MTEKTTKKKTSKKTKTTPPKSVAEEEKDDATPTKQRPKEEEHATIQTTTTTPSSAVKKLPPQITVARLLNETQLGVAVHKRIARQMTELRHVNGNETFSQEMCACLLHVLLEYKVLIRLSSSSSLFVFISSSSVSSSSFESDFENEIQKNFSFVPLFVSLDFKSIRTNKTLILLL